MARPVKDGEVRNARVTVRLPASDLEWLVDTARRGSAAKLTVNDLVLMAIRKLRKDEASER